MIPRVTSAPAASASVAPRETVDTVITPHPATMTSQSDRSVAGTSSVNALDDLTPTRSVPSVRNAVDVGDNTSRIADGRGTSWRAVNARAIPSNATSGDTRANPRRETITVARPEATAR